MFSWSNDKELRDIRKNNYQKCDENPSEKKRAVRGNQKPYITKALRKAITRRYFLKNKAKKTGDANFINLYKRQRNIAVNMNREAKKSYCHTLSHTLVRYF